MRTILKISALALAGSVAASAAAGGFSRGSADTDILFEQGNFNLRSSAVVVSPNRAYETIEVRGSTTPVAGTDNKYTNSYVIFGTAAKANLTDDLRCAQAHTHNLLAVVSLTVRKLLPLIFVLRRSPVKRDRPVLKAHHSTLMNLA